MKDTTENLEYWEASTDTHSTHQRTTEKYYLDTVSKPTLHPLYGSLIENVCLDFLLECHIMQYQRSY